MMTSLTNLLLITLLLLANGPTFAENPLDYQPRGDHWEGIKPRSVSAFDLELLSALVDYNESQTEFPSHYKLLFYMNQPAKVNLTVQELVQKEFYQMDRVREKETWRQGFNPYQWSTDPVIKPLELPITKLGVVAEVNSEPNRPLKQIAPVVFYHTRLPTPIRISRYLFAFKVGSTANLNYAIYQGDNPHPLVEGQLDKRVGNEPFMITWDCAQAPAGEYKLVVAGTFLRDNSDVSPSAFKFYHQPEIEGNF